MNNKEKTKLQKEILDTLEPNCHGRAILAPRVGKTKLVIDLIKRDKPNSILWVTPSAKLADEDIPKEFETWKAKRFIKKLTTTTWMSLNKIVGEYDLIVLDEEQFATENNLQNLLSGDLSGNIFSMTGTETKHEDKLKLYQRLNLEVLYRLDINSAVDVGVLSNYTIKVVEVDMGTTKTVKAGTKDNPFMTSELANYEYLSKVAKQAIIQGRKDATFRILNRMRAIKNSPSKFEAAKYLVDNLEGRKLIFSASIKQAEALCNNTYHSKTDGEDLRAFQNGDIDEIAMVNAGGTGFTYKVIDHLILVQSDSDKNGLTSQKLARTLLAQKDYEATIWIVCLIHTQDEKWVESALKNFDKTKVEYIRFKNIKTNEKIQIN